MLWQVFCYTACIMRLDTAVWMPSLLERQGIRLGRLAWHLLVAVDSCRRL